jgi:hypothetical protein
MASPAETTLNQSGALAHAPGRPIVEYHPPAWLSPNLGSHSTVDISPSEIVRRHSAAWSGLHVETVQVMRHTPFEYGFRAPRHLLIALELGERLDGETVVEGLPRSTLRDFTHKLTFVPAGHDFRSWQKPRVLTRVTHFYIDPREPLADPALRFGEIEFKPRLFFYDRDLRETALKFKSQVENPGSMPRLYAEALGIVLTHELHQQWRCTPRAGQSWWPCGLAAKAGGRLYRGACRRRHSARDPSRVGTAEPVPFLPVVQEFLRHPAASISREPPNRTGQATIGESRTVRHHDCARCWLWRDQQVQCRVSQADRPNPEPLSPQSRLEESRADAGLPLRSPDRNSGAAREESA